MAVTEIRQGHRVYLVYNYRDGDRHVRIYCGRKDKAETAKKLKAAKRQHYEARLRRMQERFG